MKKSLNLNCPLCGSNLIVEHFSSYNLQEEGHSIDSILNDSWIQHKCKNCNNYITVYDIMMFHDMKIKTMVFFFPKNSGSYEEHQKLIKKYKYPLNYTIRIVEDSYNNFKEKILIFENGLNDCAIEMYKSIIILEKFHNQVIQEAHVIFDGNSIPIGFAFYGDLDKPICVPFDEILYKKCLSKSKKFRKNKIVHYSLMNK